MKKIKLISILSLLLVAAMLLASCGSEDGLPTIASYDAVVNPNYNVDADLIKSATELGRVDDYTLTESNSHFAVFEKQDDDDPNKTTIKVLSLRTGAVVVSQTTDEETQYSVTLNSNTPTFTLRKRYGTDFKKSRYTLYDTAGNTVASTSSNQGEPSLFADMILYGQTLYKEDNKGNLTEVKTIPENLALSAPYTYSSDYFYYQIDCGFKVYDRDFNFVNLWEVPLSLSHLMDNDIFWSVLNNGNVLIQYAVKLDAEASAYDFADVNDGEITKYDLCTLIFNVQTGSTTAVETNYVFDSLISAYRLSEIDDEDNPRYADGFENIAAVYEIVDQRIHYTTLNYVLVKNSGSVTASLQLANKQRNSLPSKLADNTYLVSTRYGRAIVDNKGTLLLSINNTELDIVGQYIIGENTIYNLKMETVYDLKQNDAEIISTFDGAIFIAEETSDDSYEIIRLKDGETSTVCITEYFGEIEDSEEKNDFEIYVPVGDYPDTDDFEDDEDDEDDDERPNDFVYDEYVGYYAVYRASTDEYSYYNAKGDLLLKGDYQLETVVSYSAYGTAVLKSETGEYFFLSK